MSVVYVITRGSYSDYEIKFATLDVDVASEYVEFQGDGEYRIETFTLVTETPEQRATWSAWGKIRRQDIREYKSTRVASSEWRADEEIRTHRWVEDAPFDSVGQITEIKEHYEGPGVMEVSARRYDDEEKARKVVVDMMAQWVAEHEGVA